jgi:tRNA-specific 2-thiouridylase
MSKVLVGMSGGVDSSVAAYLLKEKGYEVEGLSLILWEAKSQKDLTTCCSLQAMEEASKTACQIGIPHSTVDVRDYFTERVIEPFIDAYITGSTPNPCILCNRYIKFPFLMKEAEKRGADFIATGHYAKVEKSHQSSVNSHQSAEERVLLKKGIDLKKDQSYVLYILSPEELHKLVLPLGYYRKNEVRNIAEELNLSAIKRPESQEICFIEDRNYFKFIDKLSPVAGKPGPIIDMTGKIIGMHKGIYGYTVGQRKGLGISSSKPFYVVKIDAVKNTVYVGSQDDAKKKDFFIKNINLIYPLPLLIPLLSTGDKEGLPKAGAEECLTLRASVKVRSMMRDKPATITYHESKRIAYLVFDEPQWAPAPGQSAVFYDGDIVIGGGVIKRSV